MHKLLNKIFYNQFTDVEYFSFSLKGWVFPVMCWAILYFFVTLLFGKTMGIIFSVILFIPPFFFVRLKIPSTPIVLVIIFLIVSVLFRLAWLEQALLPSYFDSAEHYKNIQNLLNIYEHRLSEVFKWNYYHLGYHFLSAALIYFWGLNEIEFMLVFGQVILAILPISIFFILKRITQSNLVAFFASFVAGFGFHMPVHLINWGKYPALLSLAGIPFVLCFIYYVMESGVWKNQKFKIYSIIIFSVLVTSLIHTRSLIVFILIATIYFITLQLKQTPIRFQFLAFELTLFVLVIEVLYIQQNPVLIPLLERYFRNDIWVLTLVLLLIPFSIRSYPNPTLFLLLTFSLFILTLFFPISLLDYGTLTLLDRPYVQMLIYLPLAVLVSLGFASLIQSIQNFSNAKLLTPIFSIFLFGFLLFNGKFNQDFYPSDCCQLVSRDDLSAIVWIEKNTKPNARILIATTQLYVTSYEATTPAAVDAGIWIESLTSRDAPAGSIELNFATAEAHAQVCSQYIDYIYIGSMPQSFNEIQLASQPSWYQPVFLLPKAQVYQVTGCD